MSSKISVKICLQCKKWFSCEHGNTKYCSELVCKRIARSQRQTRKYKIGDDAKKAIQKNHEIFTSLLGKNASGEFELSKVLKMRFNQSGFYGIKMAKDKLAIYSVYDFIFQITGDIPQKIKIWKASKQ